MQAYVRNYIRACEAFGWDGGPAFSTEITRMVNKAEKRDGKWSQSRFFTNLPFQNITQSACDSILDMFEDRMGMLGCFLYLNPLRNYAKNHVFGLGDGVQTEFQLAYVSGVGDRLRRQNVYALYVPVIGTDEAAESEIDVRVNDSPTVAVTIDHDRGKVIFDAAPSIGAVLTWSGHFSHWVRFDQDRAPFSIDNKSGGEYVVNGDVEIIEVNPPRHGELSSSS